MTDDRSDEGEQAPGPEQDPGDGQEQNPGEQGVSPTSRRVFLGGIGVAGAVAVGAGRWWGGGAAAPGAGPAQGHLHGGGSDVAPEAQSPHSQRDALQFFNPHQASTVNAAVARIVPGDEDSPGAREAGVVFYIDHLLAQHTGYPEPAYMQGPFAQTYDGDEPPDEDGEAIWVQAEELERYGRQSPFVPRELYRMGIARMDALAQQRHDEEFVDLTEAQQDQFLADIEDEEDDVTELFGDLAPGYFFDVLRTHTLQGFFSDPVYGGNRDMVGWRLVGFPGSRRSYSPQDMFNENYDVTPQSLLDLPPFNADHHRDHGQGAPAVRTRHPNGPID